VRSGLVSRLPCKRFWQRLPDLNRHSLRSGNYGGSTSTILPQPGSTAICGGLHADIPSGFTTDQRGFSNASPAGYGVANCSDSGSVQTDYTAVAFATPDGPYAGAATVAGTVPRSSSPSPRVARTSAASRYP